MSDQDQHQLDLAELRAIRERIDKAIIDLQRVAFDARTREVREAVMVAVEDLYFHGGKHEGKTPIALTKIVRILAPEIHEVLDNEGAREADKIVEPMSDNDT